MVTIPNKSSWSQRSRILQSISMSYDTASRNDKWRHSNYVSRTVRSLASRSQAAAAPCTLRRMAASTKSKHQHQRLNLTAELTPFPWRWGTATFPKAPSTHAADTQPKFATSTWRSLRSTSEACLQEPSPDDARTLAGTGSSLSHPQAGPHCDFCGARSSLGHGARAH